MKKKLAILGAGDLGQQIAHYAITDRHYAGIVFFDDLAGPVAGPYQVLGGSELIESEFGKKTFDEILLGIGYKHLPARQDFYEKLKNKIPFGKIIHSSSWVDPSARVEAGCVIYPRCCIDARAVIRANTVLNLSCVVAHDSVVGKHCFLSPGVTLAGYVTVGEACFLGIHATAIDNLKIVSRTQLGGGSVVIEDIQKPGLYAGNPVRWIREPRG